MMIDVIPIKIEGHFNVYDDGMNIGRICKYSSGLVTFEGIDIIKLETILTKMKELQGENKS